ncbi:hypothetical protein [Roseibium sp.]
MTARRVPSSQALADDVDNPADDTAIIDMRPFMRSWGVLPDTLR